MFGEAAASCVPPSSSSFFFGSNSGGGGADVLRDSAPYAMACAASIGPEPRPNVPEPTDDDMRAVLQQALAAAGGQ